MKAGKLIENALTLDIPERANVALRILESIAIDNSMDDDHLSQEADERNMAMDIDPTNSISESDFLLSFQGRVKRTGWK